MPDFDHDETDMTGPGKSASVKKLRCGGPPSMDSQDAEDKATSAQKQFMAAIECVSDGFALFDADDRMVFCNSRFKELNPDLAPKIVPGISFEEMLRDNVAAGRILDVLSDKEAFIRKRMEQHRNPRGPLVQQRRDGRWLELREERMSDGSTFLVNTDITERKLAEDALRESEARFRILVEYAPEAITILDVDTGLYADANPMAEVLHGLPRDELIGKMGPADLSPEIQLDGRPSSEAAPDYLSRALAGEFPKFEWMHLAPDGQETLCEVSLARLPDPHRNLVRASISDITERKAAEAQRPELEAKLAQAKKLEAVGQLTGGVAHDFNNLLAVILGNLEFAKEELEADSSLHLLLDPALRATKRGGELTQRLLSFSRRQALRPQTVDLDACVTGMTGMLRRTLGETIEIEPIIASGLWTCEVDPGQLENALLNLAVNARDAMPKGGRLTIETANIELDDDYAAAQGDVTPGHYVRLSVTDTGTGIPSENIEHVFEPFFTTKGVGKGSGLGLSMVFGFAKQSGGHVTISSELGCGTTVQLYLPQAEAPVQPAAQEPATRDPEAQGETVLVVEDDPDVRSLAISLLQRLGYNVLEAGDGTEALAALQVSSHIDLLLSDVVLPGGVSGPDLAGQVTDRYPGIKVLFMSGYPDAPHRRDPLVENTELLAKPFGKHDLAQKVRAVLNG